MKLDMGVGILWGLVLAFMLLTLYRKGWAGVREGFSATWGLLKIVLAVIPVALMAAALAAQMIPRELIAALIGDDTGLTGMAIAAVAGGMLPSGPFLSFPIALSLFGTGAGQAQLVAFLTGWSVYGFYRMAIYELPMMGIKFAMIRLGASLILPLVAGTLAGVLFQMF